MKEISSDDLQRFLKSDQEVLVRMGLAIAKIMNVSNEILGEILWMYMYHEDSKIRSASKSSFFKIASLPLKNIVKKGWKASDRITTTDADYTLHSKGNTLSNLATSIELLKQDDSQSHQVSLIGVIVSSFQTSVELQSLKATSQFIRVLGLIANTNPLPAKALDVINKEISNNNDEISSEAIKALGKIGLEESSIESIIKCLEGPRRSEKRKSAALVLSHNKIAIAPLTLALTDNVSGDVSAEILEQMALNPLRVEEVISNLVKSMENKDTRKKSIVAMGNILSHEKISRFPESLQLIIQALDDTDTGIRLEAIDALGKIATYNEITNVKPLLAQLKSKDNIVRIRTAETLSFFLDSSIKMDITPLEICESIIAVLENWELVGLVLWCDSKLLNTEVSKKLSIEMKEIPQFWEDKYMSNSDIIERSGKFRVRGWGHTVQVTKRSTTCRGSVNIISDIFSTVGIGNKCKGEMKKGDLRLRIDCPNPNNPEYETTYYYCASCTSTYLNAKKRYDIIKENWPIMLQGYKKKIKPEEV